MTSNITREFYDELATNLGIDEMLKTIEESKSNNSGLARFSTSQIDHIMDLLDQDIGKTNYLIHHSSIISPVSLSLYVLNDSLWKIMERRDSQSDKMLAMSTIPICTWEKSSVTATNPSGVKRWDIHPSAIDVVTENSPKIRITGQGGDFCGFIEQSMKTSRHFGIPESNNLIPNYQSSRIAIDVDLTTIKAETNPLPTDNLDYDFADSAKVYFDHGILLSGDGNSFQLAIDRRKPLKLKGDVLLFIGRRESEEEKQQEVLADIWFQILKEMIENSILE
ncbi:MAG: hypothetical protein RTV72_08155 [Candidatus Thorarchaeota archaeon]